jgi:DNA repair protein RecN (Recombination protein N)
MLLELMIENLAVIERLRIRLQPGLNVLTGETGSGKSIVVDALNLLLGGRASAEMVRSGTDRMRVAGIFELPSEATPVLEQAGIELEDDELLVEREVLSSGKSRAFLASRPVTAAILRDLAPFLGDIHGQHDQQQLFSPASQLDLLDSFARTSPLVAEVRNAFRSWADVRRQAEELSRQEQERLRLLDLWTFQRSEIEKAKLEKDEDSELENERRVLQNVTRLMENATAAYDALYESEYSASSQLRSATKKVEDLARIDESLAEVLDTLKPAQIAISEASATLRDYLGKLEADPDRLEAVENRLDAIAKLKRKYGNSIDEILAFLHQITQDIDQAEGATERKAALEKQAAEHQANYDRAAHELSSQRAKAAKRLEKQVQAELKHLAMGSTEFRIELQAHEPSATGIDGVRFLVSANVGEEPKPLERIASGGEISRIALALKTCVVGQTKGERRTLVFDEVDAGVGGSAGEMVGRKLKQIAAGEQVLCVTHLAQIASFADQHFAVEKRTVHGRTVAETEELRGDTRVREIGRMLSGQRLTPEALKHAEQLIKLASAT